MLWVEALSLGVAMEGESKRGLGGFGIGYGTKIKLRQPLRSCRTGMHERFIGKSSCSVLQETGKVIIDAYVEVGLVLENDAKQKLKLHTIVMNTRHRKSCYSIPSDFCS
ncbi:hypothetical protein glysoja_041735 [Glycine soja]|uniref:Uncharacterized protein n=1 Tax=Glycine soja TaxID=3848 RepID=A0A0B2SJP4_GLYSO|nr:hypothetical protein glysoja_041735 [Glycine soja]